MQSVHATLPERLFNRLVEVEILAGHGGSLAAPPQLPNQALPPVAARAREEWPGALA